MRQPVAWTRSGAIGFPSAPESSSISGVGLRTASLAHRIVHVHVPVSIGRTGMVAW